MDITIPETLPSLSSKFLANLDHVKETAPGKNVALCPSHDDRTPSLAISERGDRLLVHCRAGCRASDVLKSLGLDFQALFLDGKRNSHPRTSKVRQPEPLPFHRWDWREMCGRLEQAIQVVRERSERILDATMGFNITTLTDSDLAEIWNHLGPAYQLLEKCDELDDLLFFVQQRLRQEEQEHERTFKRKWKKAS